MRIISGIFGGRIIESPKSRSIHPMSEKMRGAIFNALGSLDDLTVLDAFGGSGAIGLEALSRGAKSVVIVDSNRIAQNAIQQNIAKLGVSDNITLIKSSLAAWFITSPTKAFNIIVADPPYEKLQMNVLNSLLKHLKPNGVFILSLPGKSVEPVFSNFESVKNLNYGDSQLVFYREVS